jgi:hypothetical protein
MKRTMQFLIVLAAVFSLTLSACAPAAAPTPSLAELQATAVAFAQQQVALTAAAMPAATQVPPTPTLPPPTPTEEVVVVEEVVPVQAPTLEAPAPMKVTAGGGDPCNRNPLSNVKGQHTDLLIQNNHSQRINLYFYLRETAQGCGYGNIYLDSKEATTISIPVGCYDFFGWFSESGSVDGYACFKKSGTNSAIIGGGLIDFSY